MCTERKATGLFVQASFLFATMLFLWNKYNFKLNLMTDDLPLSAALNICSVRLY